MSAVVDFPVRPETRPYLDAFNGVAGEPEWLARFRQQGLSRFAELGFPSRRSENWRYLDLRPLADRPLLPKAIKPPVHGQLIGIHRYFEVESARTRLVLADGRSVPELSKSDLVPGVWLGSMADAIKMRPELVQQMLAGSDGNSVTALNAGFFADGFVLYVEAGTRLDGPIEIQHLAISDGSLHTRSLVILGEGSSAAIIENYAGIGRYWRNDFVELRLGASSTLRRTVVVEEGDDSIHLGEVAATLGTKAKLDAFALLLGGGTMRHEANVTIAGDHATCNIDGAFVVSGREEANIVTTIDHAAIGGTTSELIKGVAAGRGHGAFQGKIIVREGAQQTDARQTSRNLILGRRAVIDTKPELEILADDVKCAHGASVGELDEAALFYLRARGIPTEEARRLLIEGFLREPIEGIVDPAIREHLLRRLSLRLARLEDQ
jgi:Fe-S cluster assembly protein SufD